MDFIITFFRDILDGPVYIVVTVICSIFICACIGYLAEKKQKQKKEREQYVEAPAVSSAIPSAVPSVTPAISTSSVAPQVTSTMPPAVLGVSDMTPSSSPTTIEKTSQVGPVQLDMPQVVAIPVADGQAPAAIPTFQNPVIATAPSVQPVSQADVSQIQGGMPNQVSEMPTSVNSQ